MNFAQRVLFVLVVGGASLAFGGSPKSPETTLATKAIAAGDSNEQWMIEGEKRFRANCGRCHQPPRKFPPREMAMAVRQMRVRAMLTNEDTKFILYYVTH